MLKKLIIILLMFLSTNFLLSEIDVLKSKTYGGVNSEYGFSLLQTSDNGYAILGKISQGVWLIKTDENGDTLWTKTYGGMNETRRFCLVQTYDNGYAILGTESQDICLIRTNENGDMLWTKTYGGSKTEFARSLIQTNDNGYAILSYTDSFGAGTRRYLVNKN
ncbi:MAG: hypothetical protein U5N26_07130 [Candidatus Marinimicrobia bacterium]|nr:hypothetical protein [Candidatus Neomarinimicrobiota bacterium]